MRRPQFGIYRNFISSLYQSVILHGANSNNLLSVHGLMLYAWTSLFFTPGFKFCIVSQVRTAESFRTSIAGSSFLCRNARMITPASTGIGIQDDLGQIAAFGLLLSLIAELGAAGTISEAGSAWNLKTTWRGRRRWKLADSTGRSVVSDFGPGHRA